MARTPQFNRETALNNAMSLFWRKGYHATSMKDIEQAMDMRPGSIYAAFGSKERLFGEALAVYGESTKASFSAALCEGDNELAGFVHLLQNIVEEKIQGNNPSKACMLIKTLLELSNHQTLNNEPVKNYMNELLQLFEVKFRRAIAAGELAPHADAQRLARLYQSNILGLSVMSQRDLPADQLRQLVDDICQQILPASTVLNV